MKEGAVRLVVAVVVCGSRGAETESDLVAVKGPRR